MVGIPVDSTGITVEFPGVQVNSLQVTELHICGEGE